MTRTNEELGEMFCRNIRDSKSRLWNEYLIDKFVIITPRIYKMIQSYRRKFPRIIKTTTLNRLRNRRRKLK